jgi:hypothetical protein
MRLHFESFTEILRPVTGPLVNVTGGDRVRLLVAVSCRSINASQKYFQNSSCAAGSNSHLFCVQLLLSLHDRPSLHQRHHRFAAVIITSAPLCRVFCERFRIRKWKLVGNCPSTLI